ncbi:MAG: NAD(P)H-dependent glycerol-3-phosphate dehydrogenase [Phycisphaerales bacterium]|nr:NAD(P)H-dependent glycerol-3-phosphate dehydrogenase [Phycisphaerales bacterium]
MQKRASIIGDGQMGLVLADALTVAGVEACVWGPFPEVVETLARTRENPRRMPGFHLADAVQVTADPREALAGADLLFNAIPSQFIRPVWTRLAEAVPEGCPVVSVAKGIENDTLLRPSEVLKAAAPRLGAACALSGPTIATELAARQPAVMVAASDDPSLPPEVQARLDVPWLRIYAGSDLLGVELAGACKNVIALAAGICDGLRLGDNAKSAVLARGLVEITRLGTAMGADAGTFYGVAGVGDLATTCFSPHGRNRTCGEALGRGQSLAEFQASSDSVVEGVATARSLSALATRFDVEMPIVRTVHAVLFEGLKPADGVVQLMARASGAE